MAKMAEKKEKIPQKKSERKKLVLLDVHAILHRAYHAIPDFMSSKGEPTGGLYGVVTMLIKILGDIKPDYVVACYDLPQPTHRHEVYKEYKAGRKKADDALVAQIKRSRDIFDAFGIPVYDHPGFEADDILGTIVEKLKDDQNVDIVIASGDMDTLQLVEGDKVVVYTLKKGIKDTVIYNEKAVIERFGFAPALLPDYKGLRGDASDNIIGIAGIGEKTASSLIQHFGSLEDMYIQLKKNKDAFLKAGCKERIIDLLEKGEEEAMFSKMLALIRRDAPISFVMPEKHWKESVDMAKVDKLFGELEFRTLGTRLRQAVYGETVQEIVEDATTAEKDVVQTGKVSPEEFRQVAIALWVLDSNITDPTIDDIYTFTKTREWKHAKEAIFTEIEKRNLKKVYADIELPLIPIIEKMEKRGVKVDCAYLKELSKEYHGELSELEREIWKHADTEFNISSPKQLGEVLFDKLGLKTTKKTAGGARTTKESELVKLAQAHPIIPLILRHRELSKLVGTYIDTIPALVDTEDRLHAKFIQTGTTTGRMSSKDPNLQNIPIKSVDGRKIRNAFIAGEGFSLVSFDYSQIELRIAAFLSKDKKLIDIFKTGRDIHTEVAAEVFGVPADLVDKEMRRRAKVINFGIIYGMGVNALRQNLSEGGTAISRTEAQTFYNEYFKNFSGLAAYLDSVKAEVERKGYTETFFGRRRYFEGINSKIPFIKAAAERMAINAPIQGTEADIIKLASIHIEEYLRKNSLENDAHLLLQVHDELVYEITTDKAKKIAEDIKHIMEKVVDPKEIEGITCVAEYAIGRSWGELK
jgi:DNA polymerase I